MELILAWVFLSFIVERAVEVTVRMLPFIKRFKFQQVNIEMTLAFAFSLILAFGASLDFFSMFNITFGYAHVGLVLSALFMSAGSNFVHDIIEWVKASKQNAKTS